MNPIRNVEAVCGIDFSKERAQIATLGVLFRPSVLKQ